MNLSAHLVGLKQGFKRGVKVNGDTVIGYAGKSGGGDIPVGPVHLHTAFYRNPQTTPDGSPCGGAGLKVVRNHYVGTAAKRKDLRVGSRVYTYDKVKPRKVHCREDRRCGKRFLVSN